MINFLKKNLELSMVNPNIISLNSLYMIIMIVITKVVKNIKTITYKKMRKL